MPKGQAEDGQGNTIEDEAFFPELPRLVKVIDPPNSCSFLTLPMTLQIAV